MSDLVPAETVEQIVGARRHATEHLGRADTNGVTILHSADCRAEHDAGRRDLRDCAYSLALDLGMVRAWRMRAFAGATVGLTIYTNGSLWPAKLPADAELLGDPQ